LLSTQTYPGAGVTWYYTSTSTDGGRSWTTSAPGNSRVAVYEYGSTSNEYIFAATELGLYRSVDTGKTWVSMNNGLPSNDVRSLASNSVDIVFAGTNSHGVFYSKDYGVNWNSINIGLTDTVITSLFCNADGYLFAGTANGGIFKTIQRTTSVDQPINQSPAAFTLQQNYPNPFNPSTVISYTVPIKSFVTLKIFNLLGKEIATMFAGNLEKGTYMQTWNATSQSSGVYFCRLTTGDLIAVNKMLFIK
jgi:hypothetical protein